MTEKEFNTSIKKLNSSLRFCRVAVSTITSEYIVKSSYTEPESIRFIQTDNYSDLLINIKSNALKSEKLIEDRILLLSTIKPDNTSILMSNDTQFDKYKNNLVLHVKDIMSNDTYNTLVCIKYISDSKCAMTGVKFPVIFEKLVPVKYKSELIVAVVSKNMYKFYSITRDRFIEGQEARTVCAKFKI